MAIKLKLLLNFIIVPGMIFFLYSAAIAQNCGGYSSPYDYYDYDFADYGGVSLSKTAQLMVNINDITGAAFDDKTGQIVLYGKQDASLPPMNLDDLAVAVRSIYGYGGKTPQDPGVFIGTEPSNIAGQMKVRYDGQTYNTKFGSTMFASDRLLKTLTLGIDNITGAPVSSGVPGFMNMLDRYQQAGGGSFPQGSFYTRMWFVPKEIRLGWSNDKSSIVFNAASMEFDEGKHYGVVAQEVEKVLPETVKVGPDGHKGVAYTEMIPVLIEAMKEQQRIIENQKKEMEELKAKVQKLEAKGFVAKAP